LFELFVVQESYRIGVVVLVVCDPEVILEDFPLLDEEGGGGKRGGST